jgi:hypothetical protein
MVVHTCGWGVLMPAAPTDRFVAMQNPAAEREAKAKRTPGRIAAGIFLVLLGLGIALAGIYGSGPGIGECNADGQCQHFVITPYHNG